MSNISELILATSNLYAFKPINYAYVNNKFIEYMLLVETMGFSFLYSLAGSYKHHITGFNWLIPFETYLFNAHSFFTVTTICYIISQYYTTIKYLVKKDRKFVISSILGIVHGFVSEFGLKFFSSKLLVSEYQLIFVITRVMWNFSLYNSIYKILFTHNTPPIIIR